MAPPGYRRCVPYRCEADAVERVRLLLLRHLFVDPGSVRYVGGAMHYTIDLSMLPPGDGPAAEAFLVLAIERHR